MGSPKVKMINVRLAENVHDDFKIACDLRGASMSSLLHQFIVRTIREEKEFSPRSFERGQRSIEKTQQNAQPGRNLVPQGAPLAPNSLNKIKMGNPQGVATKKKKGVA